MFGNVITLQTIYKLQVPSKSMVTKLKINLKKLMWLAKNTSLFPLSYKSWHIRNPDISIIRKFDGIQIPVRNIVKSFENGSRLKYFYRTLLIKPLQMFGRILNAPMYLLMLYLGYTVILGSLSSVFRDIRAITKRILSHIQSLAYPFYIKNPGILLS